MVTPICGYSTNHCVIFFKWVTCMVYKLYLKEAVKKYKAELERHVLRFHLMQNLK